MAATFYMAPNNHPTTPGSNSNSGTINSPWLTFAYSTAIGRLAPGDVLVLRDGVYGSSTGTGYPLFYGNAGINPSPFTPNVTDGTFTNRITIMAENDRQAFIQSDGSVQTRLDNVEYWDFIGLRIASGDFDGSVEDVWINKYCGNLRFYKFLAQYNNRYTNSQLLNFWLSSYCLAEECEFYNFHRHSLSFFQSHHCIARRCYSNSRDWPNIPGGHISSDPLRGQSGVVIYPGNDNIIENCISEGNRSGINMVGAGFGGVTVWNNGLYGNISLDDRYGIGGEVRGNTSIYAHIGLHVENHLIINPQYWGLWNAGMQGTLMNITFEGGDIQLFMRDAPDGTGGGGHTLDAKNINGFDAVTNTTHIDPNHFDTWSVDYINSDMPGTDFNPVTESGAGAVTNSSQLAHGMGDYRLYIPDSAANLKGQGENGADLGAEILYRYQDGVLTDQKLWHAASGQSLHVGVLIAGVNDSDALVDVHERITGESALGIFPADYDLDSDDVEVGITESAAIVGLDPPAIYEETILQLQIEPGSLFKRGTPQLIYWFHDRSLDPDDLAIPFVSVTISSDDEVSTEQTFTNVPNVEGWNSLSVIFREVSTNYRVRVFSPTRPDVFSHQTGTFNTAIDAEYVGIP